MSNAGKASAVGAVMTVVAGTAVGAEPFTETWDNGSTEMWSASVGLDAAAPMVGGNPGGYLQVFGTLPGSGSGGGIITEKPQFTGSLADAGIHRFAVDLSVPGPTDDIDVFLRVRISVSDNGWMIPLTNTSMLDVNWQQFAVYFDPTWSDAEAMAAGWIDESAFSFADNMDSVDQFGLRFHGAHQGELLIGLDNLSINDCPADITGEGGSDGNVDDLDLLLLIAQWGRPCVGTCEADLTGPGGVPDGNVDSLDFLLLLSQWGSPANCPTP